jgi:hypothetical protein
MTKILEKYILPAVAHKVLDYTKQNKNYFYHVL